MHLLIIYKSYNELLNHICLLVLEEPPLVILIVKE